LLKSSDEAAFTELYNRYWEKLLAKAVLRLQSSQDAQELVQDIFIRLWKRKEVIDIKNSFHTYISAVLKYEIIHRITERRKERLKFPEDPNNAEKINVQDSSTLHQLNFQDLQQRLEASVQRLPEKCQLVFRLSREAGLSEREIAETLQISPKTVQGHITRAIKTLKSSLNSLFLLLV
jgi:RNA polymerase sigma-70 factor (ECF subfamily)